MKIQKSRLVKIMNDDRPKVKHIPSIQEVRLWFSIINKEIFDGILVPFAEIEIRRRHGLWGENISFKYDDGSKTNKLSLNQYMKSKKHFISVLAHECVHSFEWQQLNDMNHGESFFFWKPKFERFGIPLGICT